MGQTYNDVAAVKEDMKAKEFAEESWAFMAWVSVYSGFHRILTVVGTGLLGFDEKSHAMNVRE